MPYGRPYPSPKDTAMRSVITLLVLLAAVGATTAQDKSWVGKTILVKKNGIKIGKTGDDGKQVYVATLTNIDYRVLGEQDGRIKVNDGRGEEGWFDKADAVLLEDAVGYFTDRIRQNANDSASYCLRAVAWRLKGELDIAINDFGEALRLNPGVYAYINRGNAWHDKKDYDKAIADYAEAIRLDPESVDAYYNRGGTWHKKKDYDKVIADYGEAIKLDPKSVNANLGRGNAWSDKKDYDKAIADYNEAIRLDPKHVNAYISRGDAWANKEDYDKAIADYTGAIRLDPKNLAAFIRRGAAWHFKKDYDRTIADYTEAIRLDPKDGFTYLDRGNAWSAKENYDKAIADYNETIRLLPKFPHAYYSRAIAWRHKKDYAKAIADHGEVIRLDPKHAEAHNGIAWYSATAPDAKVRDGKRAIEFAKKAMELDKSKANWYADTLAAAYAETGNFEEAVRWQERALEDASLKNDDDARRRLELYRKKQPYRQE